MLSKLLSLCSVWMLHILEELDMHCLVYILIERETEYGWKWVTLFHFFPLRQESNVYPLKTRLFNLDVTLPNTYIKTKITHVASVRISLASNVHQCSVCMWITLTGQCNIRKIKHSCIQFLLYIFALDLCQIKSCRNQNVNKIHDWTPGSILHPFLWLLHQFFTGNRQRIVNKIYNEHLEAVHVWHTSYCFTNLSLVGHMMDM